MALYQAPKLKNIDLAKITKELSNMQPTVIDSSEEVESSCGASSSNIEDTDVFTCYFPDGATTSGNAGLSNTEKIK